MRQTLFSCYKSISGVVLVGLGVFAFHANLVQAATQLNALGGIHGETPGIVPTVILTGWHVWLAYAADQHRFLHGLVEHLLVLSWPLLLVMAGTILLRQKCSGEGN
jgi:hypothetical protein